MSSSPLTAPTATRTGREPRGSRRRTRRLAPVALGAVIALVAVGVAPATSSAASIGSGDCASTVSGSLTTKTGTTTNSDFVPPGKTACTIAFTAGTGTWTVPAGVGQVYLEMVGGGGGGGNFGGGGGGEVVQGSKILSVPGSGELTVTVGAGGEGGVAASPATNGTDSVFGALTAEGGGGGGSTDQSTGIGAPGLPGGGGGGGAPNTTGQTGADGGATTSSDGKGGSGGKGGGWTTGAGTTLMAGGGGGGGGGLGLRPGFENGTDTRLLTDSLNVWLGEGGNGGRFFLAEEGLITLPANLRTFGFGGDGGTAIYGTRALTGYAGGIGAGVYIYGDSLDSTVSGPDTLTPNSGQGGAGGGYFDTPGADGATGVVLIAFVPGGGDGGGGGGAANGLRVTPPAAQVARGTEPVVFDVSPTVSVGDAPLNSGATCIIDPATSACGTRVTLPGEGAWVLDVEADTLTFTPLATATPGATLSVVLRVTDESGATAEGTFSVLIPDGSVVTPKYTG